MRTTGQEDGRSGFEIVFLSPLLAVMDFLSLDFLLIKFKLLSVRSSNVSEHSNVTQNKNSFFLTWWRAADTGSGLHFCLKKEVCSPTTTTYSKNLCYVLLNKVRDTHFLANGEKTTFNLEVKTNISYEPLKLCSKFNVHFFIGIYF